MSTKLLDVMLENISKLSEHHMFAFRDICNFDYGRHDQMKNL